MYLTVSKRLEFSASHRCVVQDWPEGKNLDFYGDEARGNFGHGHNYTPFFAFHGPVDSQTGILVNLADVKSKLNVLLESRYDHKHLNVDTSYFEKEVPTVENIAGYLLKDAVELFERQPSRPVACHLVESKDNSATSFAEGQIERDFSFEFSAARRTYSPHLSEEENSRLFGISASPSGHGHNYQVRITAADLLDQITGTVVAPKESWETIGRLRSELDHRNLNCDVSELKSLPITTEILARHIWHKLEKQLPLCRVKVFENDDFFIEYHGQDRYFMGLALEFRAAHRLHSSHLTEAENQSLYGKCNHPTGHGHSYRVECTIGGEFDHRSGTLFDLMQFNTILDSAMADWDYKHLELETKEFKDRPSTGENIVQILWQELLPELGERLYRIRLWETPNNRFTLRKSV
jgi:6-pyruvoyltetrahydropterin/6-carboxytetrahydropterin synthase